MLAFDHNLEMHRSSGQVLETISWRGLPRLHSYVVLAALTDPQVAPQDDEPVHDWFTEGRDTADLKEAMALLKELK